MKWKNILKSTSSDNIKIKEAVNKIMAILGKADKKYNLGDRIFIERGVPYESDMVYRIEYYELYDETLNVDKEGTLHSMKLDYDGTEEFDINSETGGYPAYMVGAFDGEHFTFEVMIQEDNPQVESIAQELHNYFENKYGITGKDTQPKYLVGSTSSEIGEGKEIEAKDLPKDEWKESMKNKE